MIHLPASVRVYLCLTPCDMRKSFDSLQALVREQLELDAFAGHLFVSRRTRSPDWPNCFRTTGNPSPPRPRRSQSADRAEIEAYPRQRITRRLLKNAS